MAKISLENVHKRYPGGVHVVKGVTLEVPDRSFITLVGPSGCGKSTTLNLIAGLEEITEGVIRFDGEPVNERSPRERDVAMVFQSYALYPHKNVFENMAFPLRIAGLGDSEVEKRVREAAKLLAIEHLLERKPKDMSGGQRQRVALGRALVRRPRVFLFDEPLSNLDAALRVQMRAEIKKLHADLQTTFLYVTHDQAEAMTLSDRVVVFHQGVVQQYASPKDTYERPANVFVARFLGSPAINILKGRVEGTRLVSSAGVHPLPETASLAPGEVLCGVRAEDVTVHVTKPSGDGGLRGQVYVVEPMGPETFVTVELQGGEKVTSRAEPSFSAKAKEPAWVTFETARLHLFDPKTEKRLG